MGEVATHAMSDQVTCVCVLTRSVDPTRSSHLTLMCNDLAMRTLTCRLVGQPRGTGGPEWEYEERGGKLHIHPSLLCSDTGFHTAYNWVCDYVVRPDGVDSADHFFAVNPSIKRPWDP